MSTDHEPPRKVPGRRGEIRRWAAVVVCMMLGVAATAPTARAKAQDANAKEEAPNAGKSDKADQSAAKSDESVKSRPDRSGDAKADGAASAHASGAQKRILDRLVRIQDKLDALDKRMAKMEKQLKDQADNALPAAAAARNAAFRRQHAAVAKALAKLKLPEDPTRKQAEKYVSKIAAATRGQQSFSSNDPPVAMLAKVGRKHLDVLLDAMDDGNLRFYVQYALQKAVGPDDKAKVIKKLSTYPQLVEVVSKRGWEEDARKTLLGEVKAHRADLPTQWIQAVALLSNNKGAYDDLKWYLVHDDNPSRVYDAIRYLPDIDLDKPVAKAWKRARAQGRWRQQRMAPIAATHGEIDALGYIVDALKTDDDKGPQRGNFGFGPHGPRSARSYVLRFIDFRGTNKEIQKWFKKHKDDLRFEKEQHKFVLTTGLS